MKRILLLLFVLLAGLQLQAQNIPQNQRVGYLNTAEILEQIPEYVVAQEKLEDLAKQYEADVEREFNKIEQLYQAYQSAKSTMNSNQRTERENDIIERERTAKELQKKYFGQDGVMQTKSEELIGPIQERVQQAIDKVAQDGNFMLIFDIAYMQGVAYSNKADNLNDEVLRILKY